MITARPCWMDDERIPGVRELRELEERVGRAGGALVTIIPEDFVDALRADGWDVTSLLLVTNANEFPQALVRIEAARRVQA